MQANSSSSSSSSSFMQEYMHVQIFIPGLLNSLS